MGLNANGLILGEGGNTVDTAKQLSNNQRGTAVTPAVIGIGNVTNVAAAKNLTIDECGDIILGVVGAAHGAAFNVNLPKPQRGLRYTFTLASKTIGAGNSITVTSTSNGTAAANLCVGMLRGTTTANDASNVVDVADVLTFVAAKATAGDTATYVCDGTNWFVDAVYDADDSITLE